MLAQTFSALLSVAALGACAVMVSRLLAARRDIQMRLVPVRIRRRS